MEVGQTVQVTIQGYDMNGSGVAKINNVVVFVSKALDQEEVIAKITNVHKHYAFAETIQVLKASPNRISSCCPYYEKCGGCDFLHMNYKTECFIKTQKVYNAFSKICGLNQIKLNPIIKNEKQFGYRNKVMLPFAKDEDGNVLYGFYEKLSHRLISLDRCEISNDSINQVVEFVRRYLQVMNIKIYDEATHTGIFRGLMIRNNYQNEMMLVCIATQYIDLSSLIDYIKADYPLVKSIYLNINSKQTNVMLGEEYHLLYGTPYLLENILNLQFKVSPAAFMQVNHDACEKLYLEAFRMANLNKDMVVIDAYCGMGSITLNIATKVKEVYGIEVVPEAIQNANENKNINHIENAYFTCGKCEEEIQKLVSLNKVDCIFFDPPRKGCEKAFLKTIVEMKIPKIIYISCNITSACRDINYLMKNHYEVKEATPVDIFSRTNNIENVISLIRIDK